MTTEEETEALRAVVREAHEAIQDLTRLIKEAKEAMVDVEEAAARDVGERIGEAVRLGLESYAKTIETATETAVEAVYARFERLSQLLLGETKGQRRKHGISLTEAIEQSTLDESNRGYDERGRRL